MPVRRETKISSVLMWQQKQPHNSRTEATMLPAPSPPMVNGLLLTLCEITTRLIYLSCGQMDRACGRLPMTPSQTGSHTGSRRYSFAPTGSRPCGVLCKTRRSQTAFEQTVIIEEAICED